MFTGLAVPFAGRARSHRDLWGADTFDHWGAATSVGAGSARDSALPDTP